MKSHFAAAPIKLQNVLKVEKFLRVFSSTFTSTILRVPSGNFFLRLPDRTKKKGGGEEKEKRNQLTTNDPTWHGTGVAAIFMEVDVYDSVS